MASTDNLFPACSSRSRFITNCFVFSREGLFFFISPMNWSCISVSSGGEGDFKTTGGG